jgi:hypothetical protein
VPRYAYRDETPQFTEYDPNAQLKTMLESNRQETMKSRSVSRPRSTYVSDEDKRAGNEDRDHYIDRIAAAISTGHITQAEFEERRDEALAAVTKKDLMVLVADLPEIPKPVRKTRMVTYQVAGNCHFSPWRWGSALILSAALIVMPGPLFAAAFHGFDNSPKNGIIPILMIVAGVVILLGLGIGWSPDHKNEEWVDK